jgi:hypothetical protein
MNSTAPSSAFVQYAKQVVTNLILYASITMVIPGLLMNAFNIALYKKGKFTRSMKFFYIWQSIFDLISMIVWLLLYTPLVFNVDVSLFSNLTCKLSWFFRRFLGQLSSWSQVIITIDRVVCILL